MQPLHPVNAAQAVQQRGETGKGRRGWAWSLDIDDVRAEQDTALHQLVAQSQTVQRRSRTFRRMLVVMLRKIMPACQIG